ncbi:unnamed protein product [Enterobius vermicularis]|uniref:BPTI/Kunitz inhibitor domain-containing protein n=1 Tax=Enterobius vermicularis TaxID=51028 RepID=A0A0N4UT70_ENTVE|nr:unnamed protein product [Enterobius vermicularis]
MLLTLSFFAVSTYIIDAARLPDPPVFTAAQHYPSICYLPPDSGLCDNEEPNESSDEIYSSSSASKSRLLTSYYFDTTTEQCYPFGVQNCGGNENRFETLSDCQTFCRTEK